MPHFEAQAAQDASLSSCGPIWHPDLFDRGFIGFEVTGNLISPVAHRASLEGWAFGRSVS